MATIETFSPIMANLQQAEFWAKQAEFWAKQAQASDTQTVYVEDDYDDDYEDDEEDYDEEDDETSEDTYKGTYLENIIKVAQTQKLNIERLLADIVEREYELKVKLISVDIVEAETMIAELSSLKEDEDRLVVEKARIEKILEFLATV